MKIQNAKIVVILMTIAGLLVVLSMLMFLTLPTLRDVHGIADEIVGAETELQAQYANRRNLLSNLTEIEEAKNLIEGLENQFVPAGDELAFITAIEDIVERRGVEHRLLISPGGARNGLPEFDRTIDLSLTGRYADVMDTLIDIERMPHLAIIESGTINGDGSGDVTLAIRGLIASPPSTL